MGRRLSLKFLGGGNKKSRKERQIRLIKVVGYNSSTYLRISKKKSVKFSTWSELKSR